MLHIRNKQSGFTIVELLIVIVVIAILAAISIVAYNGIQSRAEVSKINSDLASINKAIHMFYIDTGAYPNPTSPWRGYYGYGGHGANLLSDLIPKYISSMPVPKQVSTTSDYLYRSDGINYKLIAFDSGGSTGTGYAKLCSIAVTANSRLQDPSRNCWAWGYWSNGGASF